MMCPACGHSTTKHGIKKTAHSKKMNAIRRQRWCAMCKETFITYEVMVNEKQIADDFIDIPNIHIKS